LPEQQVDGVPGNGDAIFNYLINRNGDVVNAIGGNVRIVVNEPGQPVVGAYRQGEGGDEMYDGRRWVPMCPCAACRGARRDPGRRADMQQRDLNAAGVMRARETDRMTREIANETAKKLAFTFLTPEQRATAERHFDVVSNKGNRWRIMTSVGISDNVKLLNDFGHIIGSWCGYPYDRGYGSLPPWDVFLGQAFALETDEDNFTRIAIGGRR